MDKKVHKVLKKLGVKFCMFCEATLSTKQEKALSICKNCQILQKIFNKMWEDREKKASSVYNWDAKIKAGYHEIPTVRQSRSEGLKELKEAIAQLKKNKNQ